MNKLEKRLLFIIFLIIIIFFAGLFIWINVDKVSLDKEIECITDSDCVPEICCHPASCVPIEKAPSCDDLFCTLECKPGTLDCGQGSCLCIEGKCRAVFK